jgi:acetylornithine deacetylase/succinyl-diaminopimelate desuccinylase-like protein
VRRLLERVIGDPEITITEMNEPIAAPYKPIDSRVTKALEAAAQKVFPGIPVVPYMDAGTTDSVYLLLAGIPSYGANGIFLEDNLKHGRDERILVRSFDEGADFLWEAVTLFGKLP